MHQSEPVRQVPVARDPQGYWTHPLFFTPADGREYGAPGEFDAWLAQHHLHYALCWMENEASPACMAAYNAGDNDISRWQPSRPAGDGWFIGSVHDSEDGPLCVWLRVTSCDAP
ncbi:MAG TPA: hypothetical protein VGK96_08835 [Candidatus Sulfotelmatobacter sp.]|jgi:hypothetical protein